MSCRRSGIIIPVSNNFNEGNIAVTKEEILEILKEMKADPKVQELQNEKPGTPEELISVLADIAERKGYDMGLSH